mmetsp:Transcript_20885/g.47569  ORF Transcript_20885/g.47569 Transcript_20885/m.47569 type:complete len:123 (-) Transcript_20885:63-431(-)
MDSQEVTLMLANLPCYFTVEDLVGKLDVHGFGASFDMVHLVSTELPGAEEGPSNIGYAFVNLCSPLEAERFAEHFGGMRLCTWSAKRCVIRWSRVQGLQSSLRMVDKSVKKGRFCGHVILRF